MFDEDPGSVKQGEAHWIMGYMRSWRPTFIYVWSRCTEKFGPLANSLAERLIPPTRAVGSWGPGDVGNCFRNVDPWKRVSS